jgi:hypothetical protein
MYEICIALGAGSFSGATDGCSRCDATNSRPSTSGSGNSRAATPSSELLAAPTASPTDLPAARAATPLVDPSERAADGAARSPSVW